MTALGDPTLNRASEVQHRVPRPRRAPGQMSEAHFVLWRKSIDCLGGEAGTRPIVPVMQWGCKKGQRA